MKTWKGASLAAVALASVYSFQPLSNAYNKSKIILHGTNWSDPWKVTYRSQDTPENWMQDPSIKTRLDKLRCNTSSTDKELAQWIPYRTKPGKFIEYRVTLPESECSDAVAIHYHLSLSKESKERAAIAVHPIGSGYGPIERLISENFTSQGFDAFSIERPRTSMRLIAEELKDYERAIPLINSGIEKSFTQHLRAIEYVSSLPHLNKGCLLNYGTSLGGIIAINLAAALPDTFVASGASLIGHTGEMLMGKAAGSLEFVAKAATYHPQGLSGLAKALNEGITFQPEDNARAVDPERILMIVAKNDEIFDKGAAEQLRELMGNPSTYYFENGHVSSAIWNVAQMHLAMGNYFKRMLSESARCAHLAPSLSTGNDLTQITTARGIWNTLHYNLQNGAPILIEKKYAQFGDVFRTLSAGWIDPATRLAGEPIELSGNEDAAAFVLALKGNKQELSQKAD